MGCGPEWLAGATDALGYLRALGARAVQKVAAGEEEKAAITECALDLIKMDPRHEDMVRQLGRGGANYMAYLWAKTAFPTVILSSKLAASFACTALPKGHMAEVRPPWNVFSVQVPAGVVSDEPAELLLDFEPDGGVVMVVFEGRQIAMHFESISNLVDIEPNNGVEGELLIDLDEHNRRTKIFGRIICGVCIEMDVPKVHEQIGEGPKRSTNQREGKLPTRWVFHLTRAVKLDLRQAVRDYVGGHRGGKLSYQHIVRGHHKWQPCGPGLAARKWKHIEPYWRGDVDAPILVRPKVVGE